MGEIAPLTQVVRMLQGRRGVLDDMLAVIPTRKGPVLGEMFYLGEHPLLERFGAWAAAGRKVDLLVNRHALTPWNHRGAERAARLRGSGVGVVPFAPDALGGNVWVHSKLLHLGGDVPTTWLHNTVLDGGSGHSDLGIVLEGAPAEVARAVTLAGLSGRASAMASAIDRAAAHGVLFNDPVAGRWYASDAIQSVLHARDSLELTLKALDDPAASSLIARRFRAGTDVRLFVRDLAPQDAQILRDAEVPTRIMRHASPRLHHNVIYGDGLAYVGSAFPWTAMRRGDDLYGHSRDAGVLLAGEAAEEAAARSRAMVASMRWGVDLPDAARGGLLLSQHDWIVGLWPNAGRMPADELRRALRARDWTALGAR